MSQKRHGRRQKASLETLEPRALLHGSGFDAHVNFQPAGSVVPAGYVADTGTVFGDRGNGLSYGWNLANAANARDRNSSVSPDQRYATFNHMQKSGGATVWEIAVPDGTYTVHVVAGDPNAYDSTYAINVEGVLTVAGKPTSVNRFFEGTQTVQVDDGRLTVTSAAGASNNKVCFVDISGGGDGMPTVGVTASDAQASEAGPDAATFLVSRQGDTAQSLTVAYTLSGNATAGADYPALPGSVTIPAGAASAVVTVTPVDDDLAEGPESVVLTLSAGDAYDLSGTSVATATIADNDGATPPFRANVNFQPAGAAVPAGYVADTGAVFGDRGNGLSYGWNLSNTANARDRNSSLSADQRYDTFTHMQKSGGGTVWEIAVPNGTYTVHVVAGDPNAYDSTYAISAEGLMVAGGKPSTSVKWFEGTRAVQVSDGRLTLTSAAGSSNNKVCFVDVTSNDGGPVLPAVSIAATDASASESAGNTGAFAVTRTGPTDQALVVNLSVAGSASNGVDYSALAASVTIPAGAASAVLTVRPFDDAAVEGTETVSLSVSAGNGYDVASPATATVSIADNDTGTGTTLSWHEVAPTTVGRSEAMGNVVNGKLYFFGGYVDSTYKPTRRGDVYDPATNTWRQVADLPFGVSHTGTVAVGDVIYFAGGYPATNTGQSFSTTAAWKYDTTTNTMTSLPSLPAGRGGGALAAVGRVLHFVGGSDSARHDAAQHWALDLDNLAAGWVAKAALPLARNHVAATTLDGRIYVIGGQQNQDEAAIQRAEVDVYDPATDRWTSRAPLPVARSHITSATFVRDGKILVLGGLGPGNRVLNLVSRYDPASNTWTSLTALPGGRLSGVSDLLPDGRVVFATGAGGGFRNTTWVGQFV